MLLENCAEFSDSFIANLLRIIQHMKPNKGGSFEATMTQLESESLSVKFPGLAIPNEPQKSIMENSDDEDEIKEVETV